MGFLKKRWGVLVMALNLLTFVPSREALAQGAAHLSLAITLGWAIWGRIVRLVDRVGRDVAGWILNWYRFKQRVQHLQSKPQRGRRRVASTSSGRYVGS
jgi:hypothetical protein